MSVSESATTASPSYHGYAPPAGPSVFTPPAILTISRETGARGRVIARRTAEALGWACLHQERIEPVSATAGVPESLTPPSSPEAEAWVADRLAHFERQPGLADRPDRLAMFRLVLTMAASGPCVVLGRGANFLLAGPQTVRVRLLAPERERIAYIAQIDRLSPTEAANVVRERDRVRHQFIEESFGESSTDPFHYDIVLNPAALGVTTCVACLTAAMRERERALATRFSDDVH